MDIILETPRLLLRELQLSDDTGMFELDADPEVHEFLGKTPVLTIEESREVILFIREQYVSNGVGSWAVIEKETNSFVGWAGLKLVKNPVNSHSNFYDLGYRFIRKYWGLGYATEITKAILTYGFEVLQLQEIYAMTEHGNSGSEKVLEKSGFVFQESFELDEVEHLWFKKETGQHQ
ncbi:Protein N-acetyltransferase, RimJ/RimL family [Pseudarcicella hirudinis]|uniref:Protein N-acetyltransferase, RimJ/RimL family n=1 Tax=Pseudarcicella hirudinis TaxID=1079859 RepID=A0A1I5M2T7_9BACT|nr:GNAT family N-acetyltransferase [Pseudarcicella hirudinis]SFP03667.1 Protein N-acetyltransferase, RimJ/RimL family [Pseudarcicella hirudinis]